MNIKHVGYVCSSLVCGVVFYSALPQRTPLPHNDVKGNKIDAKVKTIQPIDADWYWGDVSRCVIHLTFYINITVFIVVTVI